MLGVAADDCGDDGDDGPADGIREARPRVHYELEWGLCGGSRMAELRAELSGRLPVRKGRVGSNYFGVAGIRRGLAESWL